MFFPVSRSIEPFIKILLWLLVVLPCFKNKKVPEMLARFENNPYLCRRNQVKPFNSKYYAKTRK